MENTKINDKELNLELNKKTTKPFFIQWKFKNGFQK